jgi:hypothetical protein
VYRILSLIRRTLQRLALSGSGHDARSIAFGAEALGAALR